MTYCNEDQKRLQRPSQSAFVRGFIDDARWGDTVTDTSLVSIRVRARLHR